MHDSKYLIVFAVMFAVALLVSHFSGQPVDSERAARARESRRAPAARSAEELNCTLRPQQVIDAVVRFLAAHGDMVALGFILLIASQLAGDAQVSAVESSAQARECSNADLRDDGDCCCHWSARPGCAACSILTCRICPAPMRLGASSCWKWSPV